MRAILTPSSFQRFHLGRQVLSQVPLDEYLSPEERAALLSEIEIAFRNVKALEDLIAWSGENDFGLRKFLGTDSTRFLALSNSIAPLYPAVVNLKERLSDAPGENWYRPTGIEAAETRQWLTGVSEMTKIMIAHRNNPQVDPLQKPLPMSVTGQTAMAPGGSITTQEILIGAGVAVGLGILISLVT